MSKPHPLPYRAPGRECSQSLCNRLRFCWWQRPHERVELIWPPRRSYRAAARRQRSPTEPPHVEAHLLEHGAGGIHKTERSAKVDAAVSVIGNQLGQDFREIWPVGPVAAPLRSLAAHELGFENGNDAPLAVIREKKPRSSGDRAKCKNCTSASGVVSANQRDIAITGVTPLPPEIGRVQRPREDK